MFTADHEHRVDVQDVSSFLNCVLVSAVNRRAEIWEHASPSPAKHVQCAHIFSNSFPRLSRDVEVVQLVSRNALQMQRGSIPRTPLLNTGFVRY